MQFELKEIAKTDEKLAMRFATKGMHLDRYAQGLALRLYARHFWYLERNKATQIIAAYHEGRFVGVLLAQMNGETAPKASLMSRTYVRAFGWVLKLVGGEDAYDSANARMLAAYKDSHNPDGELCFLAADPDNPVRGTGSALLAELERREKGKLVYLFTDDACTYQFYDKRGFKRVGEEEIVLGLGKRKMPMTCMLYAKRLG
ncbi:MAG: GNAT family N-acetyltransferase [Eggerthellaceae bacterium]|nr:GNAT family N-acetyltransferase [Eggerthellaceae bacterium]